MLWGVLVWVLLWTQIASAQSIDSASTESTGGTISGRIFDASTGIAIENVTVLLVFPDPGDGHEPDQRIATTGVEGDYEFGLVPAGAYGLSFIKSGYRASSMTNFAVVAGQDNVANFPLPPVAAATTPSGDVMELDAYTVEASVVGDLFEQLDLRLESDQMLNLLSADDLSKFAASDVADALKRVAGVNVVEGRFAIIRGLEERYGSTLYNGAPVPSPDPDKQSVQLDLFPSDIVSTLSLAKTFEAASPSNSASGSIDILTHDYPEELTFKFSTGTGFREPALDEFLRYQSNSPIGVLVDGDETIESDISGMVGGTFEVFEREARFKIVVAQEIDYSTKNGYREQRQPQQPTFRRGFVTATGDLNLGLLSRSGGRFDLLEGTREEQDTYFGSASIDLDRKGHHRIDASVFYTKKQEETVQRLSNGHFPGFDYSALGVDDFLQEETFFPPGGPATTTTFLANYRVEPGAVNRGALSFLPRYQSTSIDQNRELTIYQLNGFHEVEQIEGLQVSWAANYAETKQSETGIRARYWFEPDDLPDEPIPASYLPSSFPPQVSDFGSGQFTGGTDGTTIFFNNDIDENQYFFRADAKYAFSPHRLIEAEVGAGFWFEQGNRSVDVATDTSEATVAGMPGVVGSGSTGYVQGRTQDEFGRYLYRGIGLDDPDNGASSTFKREIISWALEGKLTFFDDLDLVAGVRLENIRILSKNRPFNGACTDGSTSTGSGPNEGCPLGSIPNIFPGRYLYIDRQDNPGAGELDPADDFVFNDQILGIPRAPDENGFVDVQSVADINDVVNGEINEFNALPAVSLAYRPIEGLTLRGAYSQTVARPSFRELGYYITIKPGISELIVGNPQLGVSDVESFDGRVEYTWGDFGDLIAGSVFYKTIANPIEAIVVRDPTNQDDAFRVFRNNENDATLIGLELEGRKTFDFLGPVFEYFSLGGNFTYIDAEVERSRFEIDVAQKFFGATQADLEAGVVRFARYKKNRRLFNQPEWIANADITFDQPDWGTTATLSIFGISEVLDSAGSGNILPNNNPDALTLDRFTDEFYQLDLVVSQAFSIPFVPGEWTLKGSVKNLTNTTRKIIYDQAQTSDDIRERSFRVGRDYSFAVGYQLVY